MTDVEPLIPGIYARSERLVQTTRDHDRDRVSDEDLREDQARDTENLLGVQAHAGFSTVSPGLLTWQDLFRPFTALVPELAPETLTRFVDTNTFYRRPDLEGEPSVERSGLSGFLEEHVPPTGGLDGLATLPAPTAWVTATREEEKGYPDEERAHEVAETVYPPVLDALADRGYTTVALSDPWLARYPDPASLTGTLESLTDAAGTDLELLAHLPFQDASGFLSDVSEQPVDGVLVDLNQTPREALTELDTETVGLGLVDARSSLVERPDLLLSAVGGALEHVDAERVYLTPTGDLQHVPEPIARRKVRVTGKTARAARDKFGGDAR